jgi:hypothetical protein
MFNIENWATEFFCQTQHPMNNQVSSLLARLLLLEYKNKPVYISVAQSDFAFRIIETRAEAIGLELSNAVKLMLVMICSSPGTIVMYLYALRTKFKTVNLDSFISVFPNGFPDELSLLTMWENQKGYKNAEKCDNCLDYYKFN